MAVVPLLVGMADDDAGMLAALRELLESAGHAVSPHRNGAALLASPDFDRFDRLVADFRMPGMDGLRLEALARARRPELSVILITGDHDLADRLVSAGRPPGLIFRKPFDGQAFLAAIEAARPRRAGGG
ncbi:MAG: response regulator [Pseudomonadota bacterium]|nr:response regulator [Pseudomonadota bacterium]MEE3098265.1 response regulator [Pseudomonadota bacterium]